MEWKNSSPSKTTPRCSLKKLHFLPLVSQIRILLSNGLIQWLKTTMDNNHIIRIILMILTNNINTVSNLFITNNPMCNHNNNFNLNFHLIKWITLLNPNQSRLQNQQDRTLNWMSVLLHLFQRRKLSKTKNNFLLLVLRNQLRRKRLHPSRKWLNRKQ